MAKINKQEAAVKKLKLYRKYYTKDSARYVKKMDRYWQSKLDSMVDASESRKRAYLRQRQPVPIDINIRVFRRVYLPWARRQASQHVEWMDQHGSKASAAFKVVFRSYFENHFLQATQNDSILERLCRLHPEIKLPRILSSRLADYKALTAAKSRLFCNNV